MMPYRGHVALLLLASVLLLPDLAGGFTPNPALSDLEDNTAFDLGPFTCTWVPDDGNDCVKVTDYSGFVYDPNNHQMLMFGGGHATTFTDSVFVFDPDTLSWTETYPPTPCSLMDEANLDSVNAAWISGPQGPYPRPISRHTYDGLAVAEGLNEFIMIYGPNGWSYGCTGSFSASTGAMIAHYDLEAGTWSFSPTAEGGGDSECPGIAFDPPSGMILFFGRYGLWTYDPVARTKTKVVDGLVGTPWDEWGRDIGYATELVYYPPDQKMYHFDRNNAEVWSVELDRDDFSQSVITRLVTTGEYPPHGEPGFAYDAMSEVIGGAVHDNKFYVFNPRTLAWTHQVIQGGAPGSMSFHALDYDPVNNVFIFLTDERRTWAYRHNRSTDFIAPAAPSNLGVE
jgi:hypothetical protein